MIRKPRPWQKEKHQLSETLNLDNLDDLLVIFCTPVLSIQAALNSFLSLKPSQNVILTDTLSTKGFSMKCSDRIS